MSPLLLSLFLLASDPSAATATTTADPAEQAAPMKKQKEKKTCRVDPANTGSRMARKICLTEGEWEKRDATGVVNDRAGSSDSAQ
jgi:hypothetical protein